MKTKDHLFECQKRYTLLYTSTKSHKFFFYFLFLFCLRLLQNQEKIESGFQRNGTMKLSHLSYRSNLNSLESI